MSRVLTTSAGVLTSAATKPLARGGLPDFMPFLGWFYLSFINPRFFELNVQHTYHEKWHKASSVPD